mmetsp:Transcript_21082/g.30933  ORF Transcript_21082/g.30933 Transcript_21082/m.30933 type:complete len:198 (+) Transcript_21082:117-710(+)
MGCNSSKKKENQAVRHWDEQSAGGSRRNIRGNNAPQHSTPQQPHGSSKPVGISRNDNNKTGQNQPVFEDEFVLSTSTQNRLKEHELMNAIITRSAGQFVDVNPASDMMEDEDPFEISREFSSQVLNAEIRAGDEMPVPQIPPQSGVATQQVLETLAKHSVTTQELSEIDNVAYLLADALSQVTPQDTGKDMVVKFEN